MKKKSLSFFVVLIFIFIFIIFYKSLRDINIYVPNINVKKEIPFFKTKDFHLGVNLDSSNIFKQDKIYLLNIWSSWCLPCREEHPLLMDLNKDQKINIVGLNYKDNKNNAEKFLKELGNPYKDILIDFDGTIAIEWGAYGVPESFLIYKNKIIKKHIGPLNKKVIDDMKKIIK